MRKICLVVVLALIALPLLAQGPPKPEVQIAAMAKLDSMAGNWAGEGWMDFGGRRVPFRGTEVVQKKLNGLALLVEGSFFARPEGADRDIPVHTTLAVVSYDPTTQKYRFNTWLATGTSGEHELVLIPDGWKWELDTPRGRVRYTTTLSEAGRWLEIGERQVNGEWKQFFEMTLKK